MSEPTVDRALDPRVVTMWRAERLLRLVLVTGPVLAAGGFALGQAVGAAAGAVVAGGLFSLALLLAVVWPALAHGAYRYAVREHDLLIRSGVVFRRWSAIPLARVQHVDTRQGPLERSFGLQRLLVYTASGVSADGVIPGLSEGDAHALRDALARRGPDDGV
jgi:membrane protein YdbS with pleckstrin-like domain